MALIHQGDSYSIYLDYYINNEPLTNEYADLEFTIKALDQNGISRTLQFYLSKGEIQWDDDEGKFYISLSQEETFLFNEAIVYQLRVYLENGDVYADDVNCSEVGKSLSKKVLDAS